MVQVVEVVQSRRHLAMKSQFLSSLYASTNDKDSDLFSSYKIEGCLFVSVSTFSARSFFVQTLWNCACLSRALHKVACVGKRALGYAIAKRMAALNSLDLKDSDGMV